MSKTPTSAGFGVPAVFSNRFTIRTGADHGMTRLIFSDELPGAEPADVAQVIMPNSDAAELGKLLLELVKPAAQLADDQLRPGSSDGNQKLN